MHLCPIQHWSQELAVPVSCLTPGCLGITPGPGELEAGRRCVQYVCVGFRLGRYSLFRQKQGAGESLRGSAPAAGLEPVAEAKELHGRMPWGKPSSPA